MTQKGTVNASAGLRVRGRPTVTGDNVLGVLPMGSAVEIMSAADGWDAISLWPSQPARVALTGYVKAEYITPVPAQVSIPAKTMPRIGLNVLTNHAEVAYPAAERGCRYFIIFNDVGFASSLKDRYPDAVVMVRQYWERNMPGVQQAIDALWGCKDSRLIYTGLNEGDECGQDVDGIRKRAAFDVEMARRIKDISGATYAAGTFSMGEPDFTHQDVCDAMRDVYAPHYNSGLINWDHHLYSPNMQFGVNTAAIWYETRWRFLFEKCGFDAASASRVYCSETGVDEGGVGGFVNHGANAADVARWARWWLNQQAQPVNGLPSPFVGGAIFQVGNRNWGTGGWAGYNVEYAIDALGEVWND